MLSLNQNSFSFGGGANAVHMPGEQPDVELTLQVVEATGSALTKIFQVIGAERKLPFRAISRKSRTAPSWNSLTGRPTRRASVPEAEHPFSLQQQYNAPPAHLTPSMPERTNRGNKMTALDQSLSAQRRGAKCAPRAGR